jgi:competence protein F
MNRLDFRCFHCDKPLAIAHHGFCSRCVKLLARSPYCGHCGSLLAENALSCGECLQNEPKWQRMVQISVYKKPLTDWIHCFKFHQQYWLDQPLARLLLLAVKQAQREHGLALPEAILPVPLFWQRHWKRGYNQSELIARHLSRWLDIPLDTQSLSRIRHTASQRELTAQERRLNLKNAFCFKPQAGRFYERIAIVDDVVTTGSTLNAICREVKRAGVKEVQVWTLARA